MKRFILVFVIANVVGLCAFESMGQVNTTPSSTVFAQQANYSLELRSYSLKLGNYSTAK